MYERRDLRYNSWPICERVRILFGQTSRLEYLSFRSQFRRRARPLRRMYIFGYFAREKSLSRKLAPTAANLSKPLAVLASTVNSLVIYHVSRKEKRIITITKQQFQTKKATPVSPSSHFLLFCYQRRQTVSSSPEPGVANDQRT